MLSAAVLHRNQDNLFSFGASLSRAFSRFLLVFLASFLLSKYEFGIFNIFLSIYFFSRLFSENSLNLPFIKFATDGENEPALVNFQVIILKILYVLAGSCVILSCADLIVRYSGLERKGLLFLLPFTLLALTFYMFVGQVLISQIKMRSLFFYELLNCLIFVLVMAAAFFLAKGFSTEKLVIIFSLAMGATALSGGFLFRRYMQILPRIERKLLWDIVHYSKFTVLSGISSLVILKSDVLMLGYFLTPKEVGVYGLALFVNEAVNMVFDSLLRVCLPKASALSGKGDTGRVELLFRQTVKNIYIGIIPIIAIIAVAAPTAITHIYNGKYDDSIALVYIFLASSMVKPVGHVAGLILGATGNIRIDNRNCLISAMLNVVCNYFFIPRFGVMAAAVTSILSFTALSILHYSSVRKIVFVRQGGNDTVDGTP